MNMLTVGCKKTHMDFTRIITPDVGTTLVLLTHTGHNDRI